MNQSRPKIIALVMAITLAACGPNDSVNGKVTGSKTIDLPGSTIDWVSEPSQFVNPFIGTEGIYNHRQAANVVPGAVLPFGMFNFGPEQAYTEALLKESERFKKKVLENRKRIPVSPGGYNYSATRIKGFSFTRLSGTGCLGASGDIPVLPFNKPITHSPDNDLLDAYYSAGFTHEQESATPGYYQVIMDNGVNVELSATTRTGIARFTFKDTKEAKLLIRTAYSQLGSGDAQTHVDLEEGEVTGSVTSGNFCGYLGEYNRRDYYTLYFVARLDTPLLRSGGWKDKNVLPGVTDTSGGMGYGDDGVPDLGKGSGVWIEPDLSQQNSVTMRVGISYVSLENARENLAVEQSFKKSFDKIRLQAKKDWDDSLGKIKVASNDKSKLTTFYTALYHAQFHPNVFSDVNGEYRGFDQQIHKKSSLQNAQYANFSGWDVYRSQLQLIAWLDRKRGSDIAQSLFNQARQYNGVWDRWTHNSGPTGVMSGDPSTIAIANFVAFGATDFDVKGAYLSLYKAATEPSPLDLSREGCPVFCRGQRPSLDQWLSLNFISDQSNSWEGASETLEQSSSDFALSQLAERLGRDKEAQGLLKRSSFWRNLYHDKATKKYGFIRGKNKDGSWKDEFDPDNGHLFVEGSPAQYLWMIPFDGQGLVETLGGDKAASERLDGHFHRPDGSWVLYRDSATYADVSNQPSINAPWMYLFTGEAHKTQDTVRAAIDLLWNDTTQGIPGQDDLGQMSSWYVFSALGLYPLYPGRADLVLSSPIFSHAKINSLSIHAPDTSADHRFIQSLKINGVVSNKSWIDESYLHQPAVLEFNLSKVPNVQWGSAKEYRPPSYSLR